MIFSRIIWCCCILIFQVMCRDPPIIKIPNQGMISGMFMKMYRTQRIVTYMGIPYAHPPIGGLRFSPPVVEQLPSWDGVKNGSMSPPNCYQNTNNPQPKHTQVLNKLLNKVMDMDDMMSDIASDQFNEDCLYLNIFVPDASPPSDGFAVIAYLHSGDFSNGSPFEINPFQLVFKQKVIVITIAYRLNILGFFTTLDGESPGNYGLMDQSAALLWIKRNAKAFGGNEDNITLMGHGSGATSVCAHLTSKEWSKDLFHKAVIMSGTSLLYDNDYSTSVRPAMSYSRAVDKVSHAFSCFRRPTSSLMDCLRRVDAKILVENTQDQRWGPIVDEGLSNQTMSFIADRPENLIEQGFLRKIPILIGFTDMEDAYDLFAEDMVTKGIDLDMYNTMINDVVASDFSKYENNETMCAGNNQIVVEAVNFLYRPYPPTEDKITLRNLYLTFLNDRKYYAPSILMAAQMSRLTDTYVYRFDLKPRTMIDIPDDVGVPHGFEQIFLWGLPYWTSNNDVHWDNADKRVSDIIMTLWANFCKFTNPTQVGVYIKWDKFTQEDPGILIIDKSFNMSDFKSLNYRAVQFWNDYYPTVLSFAAGCCNMSDSANYLNVPSFYNPTAFTICLLGQLFIVIHLSISIAA